MKKTVITKEDLLNFTNSDFEIAWNPYHGYTVTHFNRLKWAKEEIGNISIVKGRFDNEGEQAEDDSLALFEPGHEAFQHKPCYTAKDACEILWSKYQNT